MRVGRFVFLLLGFVVATLPLLSGCSGDLSHKPPAPTSSGEGGSSTTSSGGAGTGGTGTGPSCAGAKACVHASEIPFEPTVTMVAFGNPGQVPLCPGFAHVEGFTGYADPRVEPAHCPTCDCSPAACALPEEIHASAASCAGAEGAVSTPFDAPPGWEGTCTTENAVPAGKLCGGVPCAQSVTVAPVTVEPCKPVTKGAVEGPGVFPAPVWGAAVRECLIDVDTQGGGCGTGEWCAPVPPEGFQLCLYVKGDDPSYACREPFTARHVVFEGFGPDTRACSPCECGEPEGASCTAYVSIFSDGGCGDPLDAVTVAQAGPVCVDVPPGLGLASKAAQWKTAKPGTCAHSGGAASGEVAPVGAITLCCQPAPGPPP